MSEERMREAFEHWYSDKGKTPKAIERNVGGRYMYAGCSSAWDAWQAAWVARDSGSEFGWILPTGEVK